MELELNTIIGYPAKLGRDCEIHQHYCLIYSYIIWYIRMIVIVQILVFYNAISFFHQFPDGICQDYLLFNIGFKYNAQAYVYSNPPTGKKPRVSAD